MVPSRSQSKPRDIFGIKEEYIVAAMMIPLLFGCLFTKPFIVEVENFNSGSPSEILNFAGGDNQSVSFNISKYVAMGNWTTDGIFENFTVRLCPTAGTPSNLRIYWPYTNGSYLLWAGNLVACQNVTVNTSGFDSYFETDMMQILDFTTMLAGGSPNMTFNTMMLREPHMYHVSDDVWFTMAAPGNIPEELLNATGQNITITRVNGLAYTCYNGDSLRYVYQPAVTINTSLLSPNISLPIPLPINLTGLINASAYLYDLHCPPYLTEGKYRAEIKKVNITIENATLNYTEQVFFDDFDTDPLNTTAWLILSQQGPEVTYCEDNWASGTYDMFSPHNFSGIVTYYNRSLPINEDNSVWVEFNVSTTELSNIMADSAGVLVFMNETRGPDYDVNLGPYVRGDFIFGNDTWAAVCPDQSFPAPAMGFFTPGWHTFAINFTNDTQEYFVDGVSVLNCTNYTNETLYVGVSSDPLTNQFFGNMSVEWANVTTYHYNGGWSVSSTVFDNFNTPLDTSRWLVMPVNGTYAYYVNDYTDSKLWLYSYSPSNASGIISYLLCPPLISPDELAQNLSSLNLSNYTNFTGFTINKIGWNVSVGMDTSDANATDYSLSFFLANSTLPPSVNITTLNDSFRGGFIFNGTNGTAICPDGTVLGSGPVPAGNYTFGFLSTNTTFDMFVNGSYIGSCPSVNETLFLALTSDSTVEMFENGEASFDSVSVSLFADINGSGSLWAEVPAGYAYADVIVCNCPDDWNRAFDFDISSDTAGTVNITIINISYENLLGYSSSTPSVNLVNTPIFSWMAYDSNITNSEVRFQTGIGRSNIHNSKIIMADIDCANVSNSELIGFIYISRNISSILNESGLAVDIPWGDLPCGRIENSDVLGGAFIGGDIINSKLYNIPAMAFTDFENAYINNFYLSEGNMTLNITKWAPGVSNYSLPISEIDLDFGELPLGCAEEAMFKVDGAPYFTLKRANTTFLNCWLLFANSHNITLDDLRFNNTLGGPTITLYNATTRLTNMNYSFNVKLKQPEAYAIIWNLNTDDAGDIYLSSRHIHTENSMIAMNSSYYSFLDGRNVTVVFENIYAYDGIYYYPNYTTNISLVLENGTLCNDTHCRSLTFNRATHELSFETSKFSSYAIVRFGASPPSGNGEEDKQMFVDRTLVCPDNVLRITVADRDGSPVSSVRIALQYDYGEYYGSEGVEYTDSISGSTSFDLNKEGNYRLTGSRNGYVNIEETFSMELCPEEEVPEEEPGEEPKEEAPPAEEAREEILEEVPAEPEEEMPEEEEIEEEVPAEPEEGVEEPEEECCLFGICAIMLGICWYWWLLLLIILGIIAVVLTGTAFAIGKGRKGKKYVPPKTLKGIF